MNRPGPVIIVHVPALAWEEFKSEAASVARIVLALAACFQALAFAVM